MNSKIILAKGIKMDRNYNNVLNYTENQLLTLMQDNSHLVAYSNSYSFINKENSNSIFVKFSYNQCLTANYIAFQNPDYSNKWFFAWIDDVIFKGSTNGVEIRFTIDSWSTWFNKVTTKPCFVVREHVNDDTIGLHTIPEDLSVGEVIAENEFIETSYNREQKFYIAVSTNWIPNDNTPSGGKQYSGITSYNCNISGSKVLLIKVETASFNNSMLNLALLLVRTNADGHISDVENIYIIPDACIKENELTPHTCIAHTDNTDVNFTFYTMQNTSNPTTFNTTINKVTSFTDVSVQNNKCFCYPYNFLFVSNNQGSQNIYKYEDFSTSTCVFENQLSLAIGCSGRIVPKNYKGITNNIDEAIALGKYPTCSWSSDAFINWLTANSINIVTQIVNIPIRGTLNSISTSTNVANNALKGNVDEALVGGVTGQISNSLNTANEVAGLIGQFYQAELMPNIAGGSATGDISWSADTNNFSYKCMRAKNEYIKSIDSYFSKFGYKINEIKIPNITGRTNWNYIQIAPSEEIGYGEVPSKHMDIINTACIKGVTIWHNHSNLGNYSLNNTIVSNN